MAPPDFDYSLAFAAGLLGSSHCIGMCGGLVSAFFMRAGSSGIMPHVAYHGGRIGIYTGVGLAAGALGVALTSVGAVGKTQAVLQIIAGLAVILLGIDMLGWIRWRLDGLLWPVAALRGRFLAATQQGPVKGALVGGVVNGLMPCPLTLAVAIKATAAGGPLEGGGLMLAFGAGTLPAMLFASIAFSRLGPKLRGRMLKAAAVFVILLGISTAFRGVRHFLLMHGLIN